MCKTLYISDLDGTLLNRDAELSEYAVSALNKMAADGIDFSVATARTLASAAKILAGVKWRIPLVLMSGVLIYDMGLQQYVQVHALLPETVTAVIDTLRRYELTGFLYELNDGRFMVYYESLQQKPLRDFVEKRVARYYKTFQPIGSFYTISPEHIIYVTLLDTRERLLPVYDALAALPGLNCVFYNDTYNPELWYLEMFSEKVSKENGVIFLREKYGFERVIGFGDNLNDLPMFLACDVKVAVANAKEEVKAAADVICGTNEGDGVVKWVEANVY